MSQDQGPFSVRRPREVSQVANRCCQSQTSSDLHTDTRPNQPQLICDPTACLSHEASKFLRPRSDAICLARPFDFWFSHVFGSGFSKAA